MDINLNGKNAYVYQPHGAGGVYFILVDKFYQGTLQKISREWRVSLNKKSTLTPEEVDYIIEKLESST